MPHLPLDIDGTRGVRALLGPTNTGKTHRAIQRMLKHRSGMIGLPLRLLAQEVYDRVAAAAGPDSVALITGEQKRIPAAPRYWICTTEAMPLDRPVAFLAVDEIQLAGSPNRGHIFTDRLLNARGVLETWFLGSDTIAPLLRELIPTVAIERHDRYSTLRYAGPKTLGALPPRSAVVAFSASDIYELAERVRRRHGGAAVVLGALSPRARNAQVALYQSGEVRHLVATDAIGMGLNMDLDHVTFSALRKFDGRKVRDLTTAELAQIAGRAGRYTRDGSFGTLSWLGALDPQIALDIEEHHFEPLRRLYWRSSALDLGSLDSLLATLERPPPRSCFIQVRDWSDHDALRAMARDPELRALARGRDRVATAWEVCQVPDFRKTLTGAHLQLLGQLLRHLLGPKGHLPSDWVAARIDRLDRVDGDIETLMTRIAWIRTWNYVSFRPRWLEDGRRWQERCQAIEDRLSDTLHQRLTERFVEDRVQVVVEGLEGLREAFDARRPVSGRLEGLRFRPEVGGPPLKGAARDRVADALSQRVDAVLSAEDDALPVDDQGRVLWQGDPIARLAPGEALTRPLVELARLEVLRPADRERLLQHLQGRVERWTGALLASLKRRPRRDLSAGGAQIVDAIEAALGASPAAPLREPLRKLTRRDRGLLARLDVRLGRETLYVASLLTPEAIEQRAMLWGVFHRQRQLPSPPQDLAARRDPRLPRSFYEAVGYRVLGAWAVRVDRSEELAAQARRLARRGPFEPPRGWLEDFGGDGEGLARVLLDLGFQPVDMADRPPRFAPLRA
ncbi:MAG: disulfide oxidoreductase [Alphaproteobacteria bacterium]|nr:disulfide oxidoreductase [Alphaproteobacteria bacterium]